MATKTKKTASKKPSKQSSKQSATDIIKLILDDHKPLKKLIKTMKSDKAEFSEKEEAFHQFSTLLLAHAKAEEEALYTFLKDNEELREEGFEGQVEHSLAEEMVERCKSSHDEDLICAEIKVLAELVEHHIKEEEEDMLPDFKKESDVSERSEIGEKYLELRGEYNEEVPSSASKRQSSSMQSESRA